MKFIPATATATVGRAVLQGRKHSPVIMFSAGLAGTVVSTVLACRATLKLEEKLTQAEDTRNEIKYAAENKVSLKNGGEYTEKDAESDQRILRAKTVLEIGKLYAPAIAVGVLSAGLLTGAHVVLTKRNGALAAAYVAVDKAFKEYRARVRTELGDEKDLQFRYGSVQKEIVEEGEHGHEVKTVNRIDPKTGPSMYSQIFDEFNKNWKQAPGANRLFVQCQQNWANDILQSKGHIFLNEVYDMLGMDRKPFGQAVGWVKGNGDNYVSFGIDEDKPEVAAFMNGDEKAVWLDFNVDGVIYNLI